MQLNKLHYIQKDNFLVYNNYKCPKKNAPYVIFLHGLMSNKEGAKALYLLDYCEKNNYNYISFDNFGHGRSTGNFLDQTIESWLLGLELVLEKLIQVNSKVVLVGSSMGGWITTLGALKFPDKVAALICLAPAIDFTEESIWSNLSQEKQLQMQQKGWINVTGKNCNDKYPISYKLISEAKKYLLFTSDSIKLDIPVHLIHGMLDADVPYAISMKLLEKIQGKQITLKLIKDGDHKLSRESDLKIISNSLDEIITMTHNKII